MGKREIFKLFSTTGIKYVIPKEKGLKYIIPKRKKPRRDARASLWIVVVDYLKSTSGVLYANMSG
jgi:hypothetical protein